MSQSLSTTVRVGPTPTKLCPIIVFLHFELAKEFRERDRKAACELARSPLCRAALPERSSPPASRVAVCRSRWQLQTQTESPSTSGSVDEDRREPRARVWARSLARGSRPEPGPPRNCVPTAAGGCFA